MRDASERNQRSERMRVERAAEAKQLIQQRQSDAKKIFQRNSSQVLYWYIIISYWPLLWIPKCVR
jgi:hypothetical protein